MLEIQVQSSKLVGSPVPEASKIGLGLVKIPKLEVCLACAFLAVLQRSYVLAKGGRPVGVWISPLTR